MGEMRCRFTNEYKVEAVRLATIGNKRLAQVARGLGLRLDVLREWKRKLSPASRSRSRSSNARAAGAEEE